MAEYNFKIGADTTSAVQSLEALKKTMVDMSNATKSVATLAKAAAKETRNGIDIFSESANATRDLVTVLDMNKKTYQATMSPLKAWEKATKEAATAQQILSKAGADGATTLTAVNYRFRENAKETAKAKKELAEYVKKQKEASMASGVSKKGGGVWQSVFGKDLYHTFIGALSFHAIGMARDAIHAIGQTISESMELASQAREANNLYSQSFDQIGLAAEDAAKRVESSFSLAESTAKTSIGTFAQYMIGLGKSQAEALKFGEEATKVFLDIRSFKNIEGDLSDFMQKAMSGLAGNTENFRTMGLAINATAAKERLMAKGLGDLEGNAKRAAIAQEYLNMVIEQSQDAIGDFQRNFNSTQNTNQRLSEQWKSWKENFGQGLNKAFDPVKQWFAGMLENVNSMHDILDDLAEEMNAIKKENTTGNGTRYSDFRLRRMWDTAQSAASLNATIAMQQARGRTLTDAEQTEAGVKGAHDALKAMATELKIPAEKLASVVDMGNRVTSALGKSVTEFGKSIDDEIAKEKQVQEDIANAQNLLAASKTSVTTAQDALSEVRRLIPSSWMSMLTPYQRATGDYDKSSIMSDWLKELQSQYNALASANAELRQSMAGLDKNTAAAQNYADAIAKNEEAMRLLAWFASDATKSIDALRQASDDAKTALEAQAKAQAAQNDMSEFVNGLRTSFSTEKFRTMLGDDPLAGAKTERAESLNRLMDLYKSAKDAGVAQDELDELFRLATNYINATFELAKQGIKEINDTTEDMIPTFDENGRFGFKSPYSDQLAGMDYAQLARVRKDESVDELTREEAAHYQRVATAKFAQKNALSVADSATGGLISAGVQGAAAGGPLGAIIGVIAELITKLEVFKKVCEPVELLVDAINDNLSPFEPMLDMLNQSVGSLFKALMPISPMMRVVSSALSGFAYLVGSVANIISTAFKLVKGIVSDVFNGIRRSAGAIGSFLKHLVNPFKWNKLAGDIDDMKKAWSFSETGEAIEGWKSTQDQLNEQLKEINKAVWSTEKSSATTAKNTAKDNSKLQAWKELMDAGYLTGAQFSAMSRNYNGVGYKFGSPSLNASNFGVVAGSGRTVTIGQVTIKIEGSGDPEAVARAVERILRNRAVYGVSA